MNWENSIRSLEKLLKEGSERKLRFGKTLVKASDIGEQYFCEKKVHLTYYIGEIYTRWKKIGREEHELIGGERINLEKVIQHINSDFIFHVGEFPVGAKIEGILLFGRVDDVLFREGRPLVLADLKTGSRYVGDDKKVQLRMYGLCLSRMGFDTSNLSLVVGVGNSTEYKNDLSIIRNNLENSDEIRSLQIRNYRRLVFNFDYNKALSEFHWAKESWTLEREPLPTKNKKKCEKCEYKKECI
ncbi:MAG: PD-(D/E)XK nuclease family protein [Archaeoglobaceae archaeon]